MLCLLMTHLNWLATSCSPLPPMHHNTRCNLTPAEVLHFSPYSSLLAFIISFRITLWMDYHHSSHLPPILAKLSIHAPHSERGARFHLAPARIPIRDLVSKATTSLSNVLTNQLIPEAIRQCPMM
jgi:hypothetical protein